MLPHVSALLLLISAWVRPSGWFRDAGKRLQVTKEKRLKRTSGLLNVHSNMQHTNIKLQEQGWLCYRQVMTALSMPLISR